mmetsp:Transcript_11003/g.36170  ORF Transcript_11003/g.36170 Transcript_11003/m.36170 type:complete len:128 (+) Transcript_11003:334-717(+)
MTNGQYTIEEVERHNTEESAWIVVRGQVYDITEFVGEHVGRGGGSGGKVSTFISILRNIGSDCTEEFLAVHSRDVVARQLPDYWIGTLKPSKEKEPAEEMATETTAMAPPTPDRGGEGGGDPTASTG